jgi:hypothetical protein
MITQTHYSDFESSLFLLNAACLAEKQQIPILVFGLTRPRLEPTIYHTRDEHANHYPTDPIFSVLKRLSWLDEPTAAE